MATVTEICNLALSYLGDEATVASIDPPEGSMQAGHCAQFYPLARNELLERHAWGFATARAELAQLGVARAGWNFVYATPADMLKPQAVLPQGYTPNSAPTPFTTEYDQASGQVLLLTDAVSPTLRYTWQAFDTPRFSPLFAEALAVLLAAKLAGPVLRGDAGRVAAGEMRKLFEYQFALASASDANAQQVNAPSTPDWIAARTSYVLGNERSYS